MYAYVSMYLNVISIMLVAIGCSDDPRMMTVETKMLQEGLDVNVN